MVDNIKTVTDVITHIRLSFWLLAAISDQMVADLGLTASLRAVLEHLSQTGAQTVPQIASAKTVKRQSIQELVDQLRTKGLVATAANPTHRRSVLIALTPDGKALFRKIRTRETRIIASVAMSMNGGELASAAATLAALRATLQPLLKGSP